MIVKDTFSKLTNISKLSGCIAFFTNEKSEIGHLKKYLSSSEHKNLNVLLKNKNKKKGLLSFDLNPNQKIILISLKKNQKPNETEKSGAKLTDFLNSEGAGAVHIISDTISINLRSDAIYEFLHGLRLKSYSFDRYKSKKDSKILKVNMISSKKFNKKIYDKFKAIELGVNYTKDLVSEPGNILHPDEYAKRLTQLKKIGLKVSVYNEKQLKKMGCNAIVGVGQGSIRGSYLVTLEWRGKKSNSKPLAFVGKGVCFDTGGISLKPARFMEDMTYDMAGSAVVVGLMKNLALRKSKVNAVGVVGLVENMPGGNAQRPGDIVKSYSGKTIEVLNTDAEGRLVLADAITFTEKKFKPSLIVDLATLTGAIVVALGSEYAGLFSNNDNLSKQIHEAGEKVEEKAWRLPLHSNYDKLMNSKNADMQNINYVGGAGSTTAAQFLQRFILNKTPWAHLDIAGMAFSKYAGALNSSGATGYGVRLLNKFVEDNYE